MKREEYVYVARRIDPDHPQNLGDFSIFRRGNAKRESWHYHYNSQTGRLINRVYEAMPVITRGSAIYRECMAAVARLEAEEAAA
ncbi:hypothetical protein [Tsukamurella tyrosinosolvens]|uniref:hypothetical protein n=1 Tax=Tsukamurella tyrosinosolvens TaxID=57704 RepID=UPI002DD42E70|nr:hypothetical protein [Tsukamurella tyrosinosolvens]MEC4616287.1 hypothetical protein [Tsukamurella tyrosinosolvens]